MIRERYRIYHFIVPTLGGTVVYDVAMCPWRHGRRRYSIMRIVLDLVGY